MKVFRYLLFPIMPVYFAVTWLRNKLYDLGIKSSKSYPIPVLAVGNLSTGGTGKTPMIEYLIRLLQKDHKLATLSRGYKRQTKGFVLADTKTTVDAIGDEPFQFYQKFKDTITVAVDGNRQRGIDNLLALPNAPEVILLDDAFQHRKVTAGFYILLTTYANLYIKDYILPAGDLREPRSGAKRAHVIVVTKCPETITEGEKQEIISNLKPQAHQEVFFSTISYSTNVLSKNREIALQDLSKFTLVTGIANASSLVDFLKAKGLDFEHLEYADHYMFTEADVKQISVLNCIVTTEKDYMRLKHYSSLQDKLYYLPITVSLDKPEQFKRLITAFVN